MTPTEQAVNVVVQARRRIGCLEVENARLREALEKAPEPSSLGLDDDKYEHYADWFYIVRAAALKGES